LVLAALADDDLELLQELSILRESGFDEGQTASMMGDRYKQAQGALTALQRELSRDIGRPKQGERDHGLQ
jgi:hypothetical protein